MAKSTSPVLAVADLSYAYPNADVNALTGINFEINAGEYVAIIGHNGSGKSTLSKLLMGMYEPKTGTIEIFSEKITPANIVHLRTNLGIVFQNPDNQFIGSTVEDDIAFGLENRCWSAPAMRERVNEVAAIVGMSDYLSAEPLALSGGQKQRVAIASTLALSPKIIIFDEATSMLDPRGKQEVKAMMLDLCRKQHKTIISITHDMDEVVNADKVIVMAHGNILSIGTPRTVLKNKPLLTEAALAPPFVLAVSQQLKASGIAITPTLIETDLVEQLWQLSSKM